MRPLPITYDETETLYQRILNSGLRSLMVTSAEPEEGTSTLAYALAQRIAASGKKILFIDFRCHLPLIPVA